MMYCSQTALVSVKNSFFITVMAYQKHLCNCQKKRGEAVVATHYDSVVTRATVATGDIRSKLETAKHSLSLCTATATATATRHL